MATQQDDCRLLLAAITETHGVPGDGKLATEPRGYPNSLALCLIDSVQSLRSGYVSVVVPVLARYCEYQLEHGGDADSDGLRQFLAALEEMGGVERWSATVGTRHKAPGTSVLKGEAMLRAAEALVSINIDTTVDLRKATEDPAELAAVRRAWIGVHGLGKASWDYFLMLAGPDGSKADTLLIRYVTRALNLPKPVEPSHAQSALRCAAHTLGVTQKRLDHAIWLFESEASRTARQRGP